MEGHTQIHSLVEQQFMIFDGFIYKWSEVCSGGLNSLFWGQCSSNFYKWFRQRDMRYAQRTWKWHKAIGRGLLTPLETELRFRRILISLHIGSFLTKCGKKCKNLPFGRKTVCITKVGMWLSTGPCEEDLGVLIDHRLSTLQLQKEPLQFCIALIVL